MAGSNADMRTIGAAADCDVVLTMPQVSGHHARLWREGDAWFIEDLGSSNGLFVRGDRVTRAQISAHDMVGLGSFQIAASDLMTRKSSKPATETERHVGVQKFGPAKVVEVGDGVLVIGREPDCGLVVAEGAVSGQHARVFRNAGRLIVEDLGSRNGTFVRHGGGDEWQSYRACVLRNSDEVRVGSQVFRFQRQQAERRAGARVDVRHLELAVRHRSTGLPLPLLHDVSFTALDGEVVGIMGPSGSGKTSLLNVLAGFDAPTRGQVLVQGHSIFAGTELAAGMGALVGHAPQFDVAHELLTVEEAVRYSARLRGPAQWTDADVETRVTQALRDVDMETRRLTPMGSETRKTLSGGQKKRVNIAMELVLDPPVLLLDEPTSGLAAHDTMELMGLLRRLADQGRTVLLTIHQPSYSAFVQMDQVLILEEGGHVAWFGPAAVDSFEFFAVTDREPGALLERLPRKPSPDVQGPWSRTYASAEIRKRMVESRAQSLDERPPAPWPAPILPGVFGQLLALLGRNLRMKTRDAFFLLLTAVVPAVVAAIFAAVLGSQLEDTSTWSPKSAPVEHQYLVILTIMCCLFGALCSSLEVVSELPILRRELRGGLSLTAYVMSKAVTYGLPALVFPAVALGTLAALSGQVIQGDFIKHWLVLSPAFFAAACAGLLMSSLVASQQGVIIMAVFYAIVQVVFSVFVPLHVTYVAAPQSMWLQWVSAPMTARWSLEGLVTGSDLCKDDLHASTTVAMALTQPLAFEQFNKTCTENFYEDHGAHPAQSAGDRTNPQRLHKASFANLFLAMISLLGTGLALRIRGRGTQ